MKRITIILVTAIVFLGVAHNAEARKKKIILYLGGEIGVPTQPTDFRDQWNLGPGFQASLAIRHDVVYELKARFSFRSFAYETPFGDAADGGDVTVLELFAEGKRLLIERREGITALPYATLTSLMTRSRTKLVKTSRWQTP